MDPNLRILMLEDSALDAELAERSLRAGGLLFTCDRVDTETGFREALEESPPDIILLDNQLPGFNGTAGLSIAQEICPDTPVIFVSGTVGEEKAVRLLKLGATDYVLKDNRSRLVPAVERALRDVAAQAERRRFVEALRASEAELRVLAESIPQMVWMTGPEGRMIYCNQRWVDYTGLSLDASRDDGWIKPFHPDDRQRAQDAWQAAFAGGDYSLECRLRRTDGSYRWMLIRGVPFRDGSGKTLKWMGTCTDINDLKVAEEAMRESEKSLRSAHAELETRVQERTAELQKAMEEAKSANAAKSEFLSRMSHELRTPLNAILGFGQILERQPLTALQEESVHYILEGGRHLLDLINKVLDIARVEAGHLDLSLDRSQVPSPKERGANHRGDRDEPET